MARRSRRAGLGVAALALLATALLLGSATAGGAVTDPGTPLPGLLVPGSVTPAQGQGSPAVVHLDWAGGHLVAAPAATDPIPVTARHTVADRADHAFLGEAGTPVWVWGPTPAQPPAPEAEPDQAGAGGAGSALDLTGIPSGVLVDDEVRVSLAEVEGPGRVHVLTHDPFGAPDAVIGTGAGAPEDVPLAVGQEHLRTWWFDQPGPYQLTVELSARTQAGQHVGAQVPLAFEVGEAPAPPLPAVVPPSPAEAPGDVDLASDEAAVPDPAPAAAAVLADPVAVAVPAQAEGQVVLDHGHMDVGATIDGDRLRVQVKDDATTPGTPIYRDPASVVMDVKPAARTEVPAGEAFAFLGEPGTPIWLLPQVQDPDLLWPGWSTERIAPGSITGPVTWSLLGVEGPGRFALFTTGGFGAPSVAFDSTGSLPQAMEILVGTHAHGSWAFGAEGTYRLHVEMAATLASGAPVADQAILTVTVGDTPVPPPPPDTDPDPGPGPDGPGGDGGGAGPAGSGDGTGSTGGTGGAGSTGLSSMPVTGIDAGPWLAAGLALVAVGGALVALVRRPRHAAGRAGTR